MYKRQAFSHGQFANEGLVAGFELEAWLLDEHFFPVPRNVVFLEQLGNPLVVEELSRFNIEINGTAQPLCGSALSRLENELVSTWQQCMEVAHDQGATLVAIGTLPTVRERDLSLASMSPRKRYAALNRQILKLRCGRPVTLEIAGIDRLSTTHDDIMLCLLYTSPSPRD